MQDPSPRVGAPQRGGANVPSGPLSLFLFPAFHCTFPFIPVHESVLLNESQEGLGLSIPYLLTSPYSSHSISVLSNIPVSHSFPPSPPCPLKMTVSPGSLSRFTPLCFYTEICLTYDITSVPGVQHDDAVFVHIVRWSPQ